MGLTMAYTYKLKRHSDIGYQKFFDTFREEYSEMSFCCEAERMGFINQKLKKYNASIRYTNDYKSELLFNSEQDFSFFLLTWGHRV